jgi:hypothetical protein
MDELEQLQTNKQWCDDYYNSLKVSDNIDVNTNDFKQFYNNINNVYKKYVIIPYPITECCQRSKIDQLYKLFNHLCKVEEETLNQLLYLTPFQPNDLVLFRIKKIYIAWDTCVIPADMNITEDMTRMLIKNFKTLKDYNLLSCDDYMCIFNFGRINANLFRFLDDPYCPKDKLYKKYSFECKDKPLLLSLKG